MSDPIKSHNDLVYHNKIISRQISSSLDNEFKSADDAFNFKFKVDRYLGMTGEVSDPTEDTFQIKYYSPRNLENKLLLFTILCYVRPNDGLWKVGGVTTNLCGEGWKDLMKL